MNRGSPRVIFKFEVEFKTSKSCQDFSATQSSSGLCPVLGSHQLHTNALLSYCKSPSRCVAGSCGVVVLFIRLHGFSVVVCVDVPQVVVMSSLTLYAFAGDFRRFKAEIAASYNGITLTTPEFVHGTHDNTPEFQAKNPMGKVPLLETPEGVIFESNAIARYVAGLRRDSDLLGASYYEAGLVDSWLDFCSNEIELPACLWTYPVLGLSETDPALFAEAKTSLFAGLKTLQQHLNLNTYLVGDSITLADIVMASALLYPFKFVLDANCRRRFPAVVRWFVTCVNQAEFKASMGEVTLCVKQLQPPKGAKGGKKGGKKKGQQPKKQQKKKQPKKKQQKKPAEAKKEEKPDPVKALKKMKRSSFSMMAWFREYMTYQPNKFMNAMPYFWQNFDKEGFSIWAMKYNYNEDNRFDFIASNTMRGLMQRCDELVKPNLVFINCITFKPEGSSTYHIEGACIIRGSAIEPLLETNPSSGSYSFTKLNPDDEAERTKFEQLLCFREGDVYSGVEIYDTQDTITCH